MRTRTRSQTGRLDERGPYFVDEACKERHTMVRCGIVSHALSCHHACSASVISTTRRLSLRRKLSSSSVSLPPLSFSAKQADRDHLPSKVTKREDAICQPRGARLGGVGRGGLMHVASFVLDRLSINASEEGKRRGLRAEWHPAPRRAAIRSAQ